LVVGALVAMALTLALSLGQADRLLDRLSRSQDQLASVTRIEADINRLRADLAAGSAEPETAVAEIVRQLDAYRQSVDAEGRQAGRKPGSAPSEEARNATLLADLFSALRQDLPSATSDAAAPDSARFDLNRRHFDGLAGQIIANERQETQAAITSMRHLRQAMTLLGVGISILVALAAALGAWIMLASMVRPLRVLEDAARRAGKGETVSPVRVDGFAELRQLAGAFNHMDEQIDAQRAALSDANRGLEAQVSERTREIEAGREKLAEIDRTRRLFYSHIGHELRTPVTVMRGEAEIALREGGASAERLREALEHITANGSFLQRRLEDMLTLARAEDGRISLLKAPVDLGDIVRRTTLLAEPYVQSSGARLVTDILDREGPIILGDASWLQQGLLALVDNAAKFSGGRGEIRLSFDMRDSIAHIAVTDGGPGVPAADLPYLFESYYQTAAGRARGGSGLGLSVARWVVEQHGGLIAAESAPNQGLTVRIELPVST
ncbi:MAG: HAMP domain-containing sensor histidine kinase, partial [Alphaproteobacteria bacterium]